MDICPKAQYQSGPTEEVSLHNVCNMVLMSSHMQTDAHLQRCECAHLNKGVHAYVVVVAHLYLFLWLRSVSGSGQRFFPRPPGLVAAQRAHHIQYIQNSVCTK